MVRADWASSKRRQRRQRVIGAASGAARNREPRPGLPWKSEPMAGGMKTIGLVGGMSWESSAVYYRDLNLGVQKRLGGLSSPRLALTTVGFAGLTDPGGSPRWGHIGGPPAHARPGVGGGG